MIISVYNNLNDLALLLPSLAQQTLGDYEMEVIMRDDGSHDGTCAWVKMHYPWITVIAGENVGFSRSNNIAVRRATGDIFVFINADTILDQGFIAVGLAVFDKNSHVGGLNTNTIMPRVMDVGDFLEGKRTSSGYAYLLNKSGFAYYREVRPYPCETTFLSGGGCFVRREALSKEDPFTEDLWGGTAYCEDLDLSLRLLAKGWRLFFEPGAILYHNQRSIQTTGWEQVKKFVRVSVNRISVYAGNLSSTCFLLALPRLFYGIFKKINFLSMPEKMKRKAMLVAAMTCPLFVILIPYWIYRNKRAQAIRKPMIETLSFFDWQI